MRLIVTNLSALVVILAQDEPDIGFLKGVLFCISESEAELSRPYPGPVMGTHGYLSDDALANIHESIVNAYKLAKQDGRVMDYNPLYIRKVTAWATSVNSQDLLDHWTAYRLWFNCLRFRSFLRRNGFIFTDKLVCHLWGYRGYGWSRYKAVKETIEQLKDNGIDPDWDVC